MWEENTGFTVEYLEYAYVVLPNLFSKIEFKRRVESKRSPTSFHIYTSLYVRNFSEDGFIPLQYPAALSLDELKRECPAFADKVCPFSKLTIQEKGVAAKCPAFESGCPFKGCKTVGEFEGKLGEMRDQCKGDAAHLEFLRITHLTAKGKEVDVGSACPFFQTKGGCPFAKDTSGKPVLSPDYIAVCSTLHI